MFLSSPWNNKNYADAGTFWTATSHIITAVIGSGVLSLAWAIAQLGWVAGPTVLVLFAFVNLYTSNLLTECYRSGDPITGQRNYTYMEAVKAHLGNRINATVYHYQATNSFHSIVIMIKSWHYKSYHANIIDIFWYCRRMEGQVMWMDPIPEFVWCRSWVYNCCISQYDVSYLD